MFENWMRSRKITAVSASDVANVLENDAQVLINWRRLYYSLHIANAGRFHKWDKRDHQTTVNYLQLFIDILCQWVRKHKNTATLQKFIQILRQQKFVAVSEALETKFKPSKIHPVLIYTPLTQQKPTWGCFIMALCLILSVSFFIMVLSKMINDRPEITNHWKPDRVLNESQIWYNMKPRNDFQGRSLDLQNLLDIYDSHHKKGSLTAVFINGDKYTGKTELTLQFGLILHKQRSANCVYLQGSTLKADFNYFVVSQLGLSSNSSATEIQDAMSIYNFKSSVFIIDDVDDERSLDELNSFFGLLAKFRPNVQNPFIIVISTKKFDNADLQGVRGYAYIYSYTLNDYGSLSNIFKDNVTPSVIKNSRLASIATTIGEYINSVISKIQGGIGHVFETTVDTLLIFILLLGHTNLVGVTKTEFINFLNLVLNGTREDALLLEIMNYFIDNKTIVTKDSDETLEIQINISLHFRPVMNQYLADPWIHSKLSKLLGFDLNDINITRLLSETAIKQLDNICVNTSRPNAASIVFYKLADLLNYDQLIIEFKGRLIKTNDPVIPGYCWPLDLMENIYLGYTRKFNSTDLLTLKVGDWLAYRYKGLNMCTYCGNLNKELYENKKEKHGNISLRTLDNGLSAIKCFKKAGLDDDAFNIAHDIINNCGIDKCKNQIQSRTLL